MGLKLVTAIAAVAGSYLHSIAADSWQRQPIFPPARDVVYENGRFLVGGFNGEVMHSTDGRTWQGGFTGIPGMVFAIAYLDGKYYALQQRQIIASTDLERWTPATATEFSAKSLLYADGAFIAAGSKIHRSTDGVTWTEVEQSRTEIQALAYGNGTYVGVGFGESTRSADGISWEFSSHSEQMWDVAFGNGKFCAVGSGAHISTDGLTWTETLPEINLVSVAFGEGQFIAGGENGELLYSADGVTWEQAPQVTQNYIHSIAYGDGRFLAVGFSPAFLSEDGKEWELAMPQTIDVRDFAGHMGKLVVVGVSRAGVATSWESVVPEPVHF